MCWCCLSIEGGGETQLRLSWKADSGALGLLIANDEIRCLRGLYLSVSLLGYQE